MSRFCFLIRVSRTSRGPSYSSPIRRKYGNGSRSSPSPSPSGLPAAGPYAVGGCTEVRVRGGSGMVLWYAGTRKRNAKASRCQAVLRPVCFIRPAKSLMRQSQSQVGSRFASWSQGKKGLNRTR